MICDIKMQNVDHIFSIKFDYNTRHLGMITCDSFYLDIPAVTHTTVYCEQTIHNVFKVDRLREKIFRI